MAVDLVKHVPDGRGASRRDDGVLEDTRSFKVRMDSDTDTGADVALSGAVPVRGDVHHRTASLTCKRVQIRQIPRTTRWWNVDCFYDSLPFSASVPQLAQEIEPNPLLRRTTITGQSAAAKRAMEYGYLLGTVTLASWDPDAATLPAERKPLQTTALEKFEGVEEDDDQFVWRVTWNVADIPVWVADYQGFVNAAPLALRILPVALPKWSVKLRGFEHTDLLEYTLPSGLIVYYYQVAFNLHYRTDRWVKGIQNRGHYQLFGGEQIDIVLDNGKTPTAAVPLTLEGGVLEGPNESNILHRFYFDAKGEADFSVLPVGP